MEVIHYNIDLTPDSQWEIISCGPFAKKHFLYLQEAGSFDAGPNYYTDRKGLESHLIKLTLHGQGILEYEGRTYHLSPGSLFWIDCQKHQNYYTDPAAGRWNMLWVHFSGITAQAYYETFLTVTHGSPVLLLPLQNRISELLASLLRESAIYGSDAHTDVRISSLLTSLLAGIIQAAAIPEATGFANPIVEQVRMYLGEHYTEHLSLDDLGTQFHLSKFYLQRLFSQQVGMSPTAYVNTLRVRRAKEMLRATDLSVGEIGYRVGISNTSYFISLFRRQEGMTPLSFRKSWSETDGETLVCK